jgi:hypothetical protein
MAIAESAVLTEDRTMYLVERDDYVRYGDDKKLNAEDLTVEQRQFLSRLNRKLTDLEKDIKRECQAIIDRLEKRVNDAEDWLDDYMIDCDWTFVMKEDDPDLADNSDNILFHLNQDILPNSWDWGVGDGMNHHHVPWENCPIKDEPHCWTYHFLTDHGGLDWINILRIGTIWIDITVKHQKFIEF